jgi:aminopeptidase N
MVPYQWDVFATGKRVRIASYRFKWRTHVWKTKRAFPTYLLGFVAGKLRTH